MALNMSANIFCIAEASMARTKQSWRWGSEGGVRGATGGHEFGHGAWGGTGGPVTGGQISKTTTPKLVKLPPPPVLVGLPPASPPPPPRARVVIVCAFKDGVEALNDITPHSTQTYPKAACFGHGLGDILLQI